MENVYWAIATSSRFGGDTRVKKLDSKTSEEAIQEAEKWDLGFDWKVRTLKQISSFSLAFHILNYRINHLLAPNADSTASANVNDKLFRQYCSNKSRIFL